MSNENVIDFIANEVIKQLALIGQIEQTQEAEHASIQETGLNNESAFTDNCCDEQDIVSYEYRHEMMNDSSDPESLVQMMGKTPARIGVGKKGPRIRTKTQLSLRADHAKARDAVMKDINQELINRLKLSTFQTKCKDINEHLTRPDLGRQFNKEIMEEMKSKCRMSPQVQIYLSDGLSGQAIEANGPNVLPALLDGLEGYNISTGTPFFVKFGRVPSMDTISELLDAEVTCVLIGERPGLATADSMSAYIAYRAEIGMPEARRTVVSNIHSEGIPAVEAGAYVADVIKKILEAKQSGVDLRF